MLMQLLFEFMNIYNVDMVKTLHYQSNSTTFSSIPCKSKNSNKFCSIFLNKFHGNLKKLNN